MSLGSTESSARPTEGEGVGTPEEGEAAEVRIGVAGGACTADEVAGTGRGTGRRIDYLKLLEEGDASLESLGAQGQSTNLRPKVPDQTLNVGLQGATLAHSRSRYNEDPRVTVRAWTRTNRTQPCLRRNSKSRRGPNNRPRHTPAKREGRSNELGSSKREEGTSKSGGRGQWNVLGEGTTGSTLDTLNNSESTWNPKPPKLPPVPAAASNRGSLRAMKLQSANEHAYTWCTLTAPALDPKPTMLYKPHSSEVEAPPPKPLRPKDVQALTPPNSKSCGAAKGPGLHGQVAGVLGPHQTGPGPASKRKVRLLLYHWTILYCTISTILYTIESCYVLYYLTKCSGQVVMGLFGAFWGGTCFGGFGPKDLGNVGNYGGAMSSRRDSCIRVTPLPKHRGKAYLRGRACGGRAHKAGFHYVRRGHLACTCATSPRATHPPCKDMQKWDIQSQNARHAVRNGKKWMTTHVPISLHYALEMKS